MRNVPTPIRTRQLYHNEMWKNIDVLLTMYNKEYSISRSGPVGIL